MLFKSVGKWRVQTVGEPLISLSQHIVKIITVKVKQRAGNRQKHTK